MELSPTLEFVLFASGDNRSQIATTLASLRRQTCAAWTAKVVYDQDIDRDQVEALTAKNPRIRYERLGSDGAFTDSSSHYSVFVPEGSVLDEDAVDYLLAIATTSNPAFVVADGLPHGQLVMISQRLESAPGAPVFVYQRVLFTGSIQSDQSQAADLKVDATDHSGSLQDLVIEKNRQINELEALLHRKDHEFLGIERHLASVQEANKALGLINDGLNTANAGLSDANDGLNDANNELNRINQQLLADLANRGFRGLLRRLRK